MKKIVHLSWAAAFILPVCQAAEWSLTGLLNPSVTYDDNIFLEERAQSTMHSAMRPTAILTRAVENSTINLSAGYQIDRYSSLSSDDDTENPFLKLDGSYLSERSVYGLTAGYSEATSRSTAEEFTGNFASQAIVTTRIISPDYQYQLTERDSISLSGLYSERKYSTSDFSDTESKLLSAGWQRQFSERFNAGLSLSVSNYQSEGNELSTDDDTYGLSSTFTYAWSELWDVAGSVGVRRLNGDRKSLLTGLTESESSSGSTVNFSLVRADEINVYSIDLSRSLSPSNTGDVNETDRIVGAWSHNISEYLSSNIEASYQETVSALNDSNQKRENIRFSPSLTWQLEENLNLRFAYNYRKQKRTTAKTVDSNAVMITLNYDWDGIRASR